MVGLRNEGAMLLRIMSERRRGSDVESCLYLPVIASVIPLSLSES
jgi:hypothetical protein